MGVNTDSRHGSNKPTVSVIIPTYGRNEHLPRALDSINNQTYSAIETIVVDDGSPRPVAETIDESTIADIESIRFIRHNQNLGANVARNRGISDSTGKYIAFLDDDDWWHHRKLEKQIEAFQTSSSDVGVVYTGKKSTRSSESNVMTPTYEGNVIPYLIRGHNFGQFSSVMVQSTAIPKAGFPDERFPAWQDREWFFRLAKHCHFAAVPEVLTYRRPGLPDSIGTKFQQQRDIAYPLFLRKHYPFVRSLGLVPARTFLASLRRTLGRTAIQANQHSAARKLFLSSFLSNPMYRKVYPDLVASLGGKATYEAAARFQRAFRDRQLPISIRG